MPVENETLARLHKLVNASGRSLIEVSSTLGLELTFNKEGVTVGSRAPGAVVASLVSIYGEGAHGTSTIFMNQQAFSTYVEKLSQGMIAPDIDDDMAMSVIGEIGNMVSGKSVVTLSQLGFEGLDLTPPQLFKGKNIKTLRMPEESGYTFTLPFYINEDRESIVFQVLLFRK
ncbi:MAG: chemotaxis protein CheX [Synergistales bacterium]|nr:chemotaxis protein CheX [Synergistales bacterium]